MSDDARTSTAAYQRAWTAINRLMRQGYSWSGREANVCYLNTGGQGFADASSVSGFGLADDSRGLALTDWDLDGDLDIWSTNRSAPMVRLLENTSKHSEQALTVKLLGKASNRDAIGARATLILQSGRMLVLSVRAGSGYLSQSSKRLHFAWPPDDPPTRLQVSWPSGKITSTALEGLSGGILVDEEGSPIKALTSPEALSTRQETIVSPPHRLCSFSKPSFPEVQLSPDHKIGGTRARPLLLQLWAPWCAACLKERREFADASKQLANAKVDVLAISIDAETLPPYPFSQVASTPDFLDTIEVFQRALFDRHDALRLPLSILLDTEGRLVSYYPGSVAPAQVIADAQPQQDLRKAALPFDGEWLHPPQTTDPIAIALQFVSSGKRQSALAYLNQLLSRNTPINVAQLHAFRGSLLNGEERETALKAALSADAQHFESLKQLGLHYLNQRSVKLASPFIAQALAQQPKDAALLFAQAQLQFATNRLPAATQTLRQLVQAHPTHWTATNNLAWLLATHKDDKLRDGQEALLLALKLPLNKEISYADTLAASYAETGQFEKARDVISTALKKADATKAKKLRLRDQAYAEGRAWRS